MLSYEELEDLALQRYFANVDRKDLTRTLECFHETAHFTIETAATLHAGLPAITRMFEGFFAAYTSIAHRDFTCAVDARNQRISAHFIAELVTPDGARTLLSNTNFWRVRDGRFQEVFVYMSGANVLT